MKHGKNDWVPPLVVDQANAASMRGNVNHKAWILMQNVSVTKRWHRQGGGAVNDKGCQQQGEEGQKWQQICGHKVRPPPLSTEAIYPKKTK
jgi:hypothetical protein